MSVPLNVLGWYLVKYGGTRGPVAHRIAEYSSPATACGVPLRLADGTSRAPARGTWGQPTRTPGPGIRICAHCAPRVAASPAAGRIAVTVVQVEAEGDDVGVLLGALGDLAAAVRGPR